MAVSAKQLLVKRSPHFLVLVVLLCVTRLISKAESASCTPMFPFRDGWWGADAAYSIPLPDGRSVWIFGDTLYGEKRVVEGNEPRMVRNSIGISACSKGDWRLQYVIRRSGDGKPEDFFHAQKANTWYWARGIGPSMDSSTKKTCG
jgi:hypothetical protein